MAQRLTAGVLNEVCEKGIEDTDEELADIIARAFRHTKGALGDERLRNNAVAKGNAVHTLREDGEPGATMTRHEWACAEAVKILDVLEGRLESALSRDLASFVRFRLREALKELYEDTEHGVTRREALVALKTRAGYHAMPVGRKRFARKAVRRVSGEL